MNKEVPLILYPRDSTLHIRLRADTYAVEGIWRMAHDADLGTISDIKTALLFDHSVEVDGVSYLVHPEDVRILQELVTRVLPSQDYRLRVIDPHGKIRQLAGKASFTNSQQTSADLLQAAMDTSMDMIQVFEAVRDEHGTIADFRWILNNHTSEKIYGNVVGKSLLKNNPGVLQEGIFDTFKRVVETGIPDQSEWHYVHEQFNGWFIQSTVKLNDGVATTTTDITKHKEAESQLQESVLLVKETNELLKSVLENTSGSIMLLRPCQDNDGRITDFQYVFANPATLKSVKRDSLVGKYFLTEFPQAKGTNLFRHYVDVLATGQPWHGEAHMNFTGQDVLSEIHATKVNDSVLITYLDITERIKAKEEIAKTKEFLQATLDTSLYVIQAFQAVRDEQGKIADFVWVMNNWKAVEQNGDVIGKSLLKQNPGVVPSGLFDKFVAVTETGVAIDHEFQYAHEQIDGWFHQTLVKVGDGFVMNTENITSRKNAEQEILRLKDEIAQKATDKYHSVFNSIDEGFCILEMIYDDSGAPIDYRFIEINPAFERQTGLKRVIGKTGSQVIPDPSGPYGVETFGNVIKSGNAERFESYHEGTDRWYQVHASQVGNSRQIAAVFENITERKRNEANGSLLKEVSEGLVHMEDIDQTMRSLCEMVGVHFRAAVCAISEVDEAQGIVILRYVWNHQGAQSPSVVAKIHFHSEHIEALMRSGNPEVVTDVATLPEAFAANMAALKIGAYVNLPFVREGQWRATLSIIDSKPRAWRDDEIQLMHDLTFRIWTRLERARAEEALRKSEERMTKLLTLMPAAVYTCDAEGRITFFNRHAAELWGREPRLRDEQEKFCGSYRLWKPDGTPLGHQQSPMADAVREGTPRRNIEIVIEQPDGNRIVTNANIDPLHDSDGRLIGAINVFVDVTKQKTIEKKLQESERQLRELNIRLQETDKAKTNFFNNVSHELRTPLTLLIGPLKDLMRSAETKTAPEEIQRLQLIYRGAIRLQRLVNTLLDFARIEAGKLEAFYQPTDFAKMTLDLAANFRSAIERAGLKFIVRQDEDILETIYLNREMWEKIVFNLLSNALKFTHKGKIEVTIRNKKKQVELRVKDTGIGIGPKNIDRIFERFVRVDGPKARTYEGTGIGLALVRELVHVHHGKIKVKSKEGVGSEFIVAIPKGKAHLPSKQLYENKDQLPSSFIGGTFAEEVSGWLPEDQKMLKRAVAKYNRSQGMRIVIAEDNADMREYLRNVLADDYQVLLFEHGQKVLDFLRDGGETDLILADVMMPELDGYQLVETLKSDPAFAEIPIVLLTAKSDEDAKIEGLDRGADDYLIKPFSGRELRAVIRARINRARKRPTR